MLASPLMEEFGDSAAEVIAYAEKNSGWITAITRFLVLSLIFLAWFLGGVYARLRRAGEETVGVFALVGGAVFAVLFFITMMIWMAPLVELDDASQGVRVAKAEGYSAVRDIGVFTLTGAGVVAGLMIIAVSLGARRSRLVPGWAG